MNPKGKLQKPLDFFSRWQKRVFGLLTCWLKYHVVLSCRGIGQFNCDLLITAQANKEVYLELFRVLLAISLVEFQCFVGHFENEY